MAMATTLPNAAVAEALRRLLPNADQTLLLRAALGGDQGPAAWATWRARHDLQAALANDRSGVKGLLPLLAYTLEKHEATVAAEDLSLLRMARYREQLRIDRYQAILHQALATLRAGGIPCIVLKGAALANTAYPAPTLRHSHDIDLLIRATDLPQAAQCLTAHGFNLPQRSTSAPNTFPSGDLRLDHSSGLPVILHTRLFRNGFFAPPLADAWQDAMPLMLEDVMLADADSAVQSGEQWESPDDAHKMLAPEWELVHILGSVVCARARVTWVCDVHFLLAANPTIDWLRVCAIARQSRLTMVAFVMLTYLQQQQQQPIPNFVLEHLAYDAAQSRRADYEQMLHAARSQGVATYGELFAAASNLSERASLVRWMLLPLPTVAQRQQAANWPLPLFYVRYYFLRGMRYLARRVASGKVSVIPS